jgi:hypothetical protein
LKGKFSEYLNNKPVYSKVEKQKQFTMFLSLKNFTQGGEEALYRSTRRRVLPEGSNPKIPFSDISSEHGWQSLSRHYQPNRQWEKLRK